MPGRSRLARLWQGYLFAQVVAALAWLTWRWTTSPAQAVGGALLVLLIGPVLLGIEFLLLAWVARTDRSVPTASAMEFLRAWLSESRHLFATFYWRQPFRWRSPPDDASARHWGRTGVVLVHGFMCNRGFWSPWMQQLRQHGHPFAAVNLEPVFGSIDEYVRIIDDAVERVARATGRPPILVCHSMGGLAARAWCRASGTRRSVAHLVTIGSPHRGTWMGRFSRRTNGRQMHLQSEWLEQLTAHEVEATLPPATCWYSNCDNIVFPPSTATLPGATNHFVPGLAHVALAFHPSVLRDCLALLERANDLPSR